MIIECECGSSPRPPFQGSFEILTVSFTPEIVCAASRPCVIFCIFSNCFVVLVSNVSLAVVVHHHHIVIKDSIDVCDPKTQFQFITSVNDFETYEIIINSVNRK